MPWCIEKLGGAGRKREGGREAKSTINDVI